MTGNEKRENDKACIYCQSRKDMTMDHIPPKALFPEPRPSNMITVPCCKQCNESFSKDDEYFRTIMVSSATVYDDPNVQAVNTKLLRSMARPEASKMATAIRKSLHVVNIKSPGGIYLGESPALKVNAKKFNRITQKIALGLFYVIRGYPVPTGYEIKCIFKDSFFSFPADFIEHAKGFWTQPIMVGNNIFSYSYAPCIDDQNAMLFIYWFYDKLYFYGYILPKSDVEVAQ